MITVLAILILGSVTKYYNDLGRHKGIPKRIKSEINFIRITEIPKTLKNDSKYREYEKRASLRRISYKNGMTEGRQKEERRERSNKNFCSVMRTEALSCWYTIP